jgi:hypothetical protein
VTFPNVGHLENEFEIEELLPLKKVGRVKLYSDIINSFKLKRYSSPINSAQNHQNPSNPGVFLA